ncbi:MAG: hypothetical protein ACK55Z_26665, partial [bacterium]
MTERSILSIGEKPAGCNSSAVRKLYGTTPKFDFAKSLLELNLEPKQPILKFYYYYISIRIIYKSLINYQ